MNMESFKNLLFAIAVCCAPVASASAEPEKVNKPNIIFILSDDMGWAQLGVNGSGKGLTPNVDRLASEGTSLQQYYTHSVCAPTRAAFLTGKYAFRTWSDWRSEDFGKPSYLKALGLTLATNQKGEETRRIHALAPEEITIAERLQELGYYTSLVGKWHCGEWLSEHLPMAQGFDHQYGHYAWGIDYYSKTIVHNAPARYAVYDWHRNQKPLKEDGYATDLIGDEAVRVIETRASKEPYFMYVAFNAVHGPLNAPPRYNNLDVRDGMLKCMDDAVGKILAAVEASGEAENTLVVFTNDNGPVLEEMSAPFRGTKNTTFEGGVRVPCFVKWPARLKAGTQSDAMMFVTDWFKTFEAFAGVKVGSEHAQDSIDMSEVFLHAKDSTREEIVFEVKGSVRVPTIRHGKYKLMGNYLYDIEADPAEQNDIASQFPELVKQLSARLEEVAAQRPPLGKKELLMDPAQPYIYGKPENDLVPRWVVDHVDAVRAKQPQSWAPGETPWPKAPVGVNASK